MKDMERLAVEMTKLLPRHVADEWLDKIRRARTHTAIRDPEVCLPIPMIGGGVAELTIPRTMSRDAYRNLVHVVRMFLETVEEAVVVDDSEPPQALVELSDELERLLQENKIIRGDRDRCFEEIQLHRSKTKNEYWAWQGDGQDHLETLTCPVLIQPQQLMSLIGFVHPEPEVVAHPDLGPPAGPPEIPTPPKCKHEIQRPDDRCVKCGMTRAAIVLEDQIPF